MTISDDLARGLRTGRPVVIGEELPTEASGAVTVGADEVSTAVITAGDPHPRGLTIAGAALAEPFNLDHVHFGAPLRFIRCAFLGGVTGRCARLGQLEFTECEMASAQESDAVPLDLTDAEFGSLSILRSYLRGRLVVTSAHVRGTLKMSGATVEATSGIAVTGEGVQIGADLDIGGGTVVSGAIHIPSARIGRDLWLHGITLAGSDDANSLDATFAHIAGSVLISDRETLLNGAVQFPTATVRGIVGIDRGASIGAGIDGYAVVLNGASIGALRVSGEHTHLKGSINLIQCRVTRDVAVDDAALVESDPKGRSLSGDDLTAGRIFIQGGRTRLVGGLRLNGATTSGVLEIRAGASVGSAQGISLDADRLKVSGLFVKGPGTVLDGAMRLMGGTVEGQAAIAEGAHVGSDEAGVSLLGDELEVRGSVFVTGGDTVVDGGIRMNAATVSGQFGVSRGATVGASADGFSMFGEGMSVGRAILVKDATLRGGVWLPALALGGPIAIEKASLGEALGWSLALGGATLTDASLRGVQCSGGLLLSRANVRTLSLDGLDNGSSPSVNRGGFTLGVDCSNASIESFELSAGAVHGGVRLTDVSIGALHDQPESWRLHGVDSVWWELDGAAINSLSEPSDGFALSDRLLWLSKTGRDRDTPAGRATYRTLATAYSAAGLDDEATTVLVEMRKRHDPAIVRAVLRPIRQGYAPQRALYFLGALLLLTWLVVAFAEQSGLFVTTDGPQMSNAVSSESLLPSDACVSDRTPCLRPELYALDIVMPVVSLGIADRWQLATTRAQPEWADVASWWLAAAELFGWALGGLFITGTVRVVLEERRT